MLVLTRRPEESIELTGGVRIVVLGVRGRNGVRIGIDAPPDVEIWRSELANRGLHRGKEAGEDSDEKPDAAA